MGSEPTLAKIHEWPQLAQYDDDSRVAAWTSEELRNSNTSAFFKFVRKEQRQFGGETGKSVGRIFRGVKSAVQAFTHF